MVEHVGAGVPARRRDPGGGARARDPGAGARPAARPAARRDHRERRHLRLGPGLRGDARADAGAPAARGARLRRGDAARAAQGDPRLPHPRRPRGPRRRRRRATSPRRPGGSAGWRERLAPSPAPAPDGPRGAAGRLRPRRRGARRWPTPCGRRAARPSETCAARWPRCRRPSAGGAARAGPAPAADRRQRPGRALEATTYAFEVVCDYGAYRDLQRHRLLSLQAQPLTPRPGVRRARRGRRGRRGRRLRRGPGALHATCTTRCARRSRPRRPTPSRWRTASASRWC